MDQERRERHRQFSRRELLRAGIALPAVLSLPVMAAACGGGSSVAAGHGDHTDSGGHSDHADHQDAGHNDSSHGDSTHTDTSHTDRGHTDHSDSGATHADTGGTHTDVPHNDSPGVHHVDERPPYGGCLHNDLYSQYHHGDNGQVTNHLDHVDYHGDHTDCQFKQ
ncbi:MAG TPA: hypothetical protein VH112_07915 [Acidimicrobiales bacterium]|nr:hypothetical protein [Acidimicrobiales bacterium]